VKQVRIRKLTIAREHPWHEVLPTDPRDPDVVRAKTLARAGDRAGGTTAGQSRSSRPAATAD